MSDLALWHDDAHLLRILDAGLLEARTHAGESAACRAGCFSCCLGPFPITMHDAARLQRGLEEMHHREPARAARVHGRAVEAMLALRDGFPGDWSRGVVDEARAAELFAERFQMIPCPALDLETGACELYEHRPVACRTYGFAVRIAGVDLTPCPLNYAGLSEAEIEARRVELTFEALDADAIEEGQTVVAAALRPSRDT